MCTSDVVMDYIEGQKQDKIASNILILLEFVAVDDLEGFKLVVEEDGFNINDSDLWYGRSIGSKKMMLEESTPIMIASMFGSKRVTKFILGFTFVDVNKAYGSDSIEQLLYTWLLLVDPNHPLK
ncbi:unnamed protein product [Lactuca saligna]|uniref:Uncharacterized protein n=1 Tax=Lactuca saligna TaxID=75948 RepID=A0AA35ZS94_LACSI|nr:unnamed protein product [Lactuca saligna]